MTHLTLLKGKATWASSKSDGVDLETSAARVKTNCKKQELHNLALIRQDCDSSKKILPSHGFTALLGF
jgi:hypothetical protein